MRVLARLAAAVREAVKSPAAKRLDTGRILVEEASASLDPLLEDPKLARKTVARIQEAASTDDLDEIAVLTRKIMAARITPARKPAHS